MLGDFLTGEAVVREAADWVVPLASVQPRLASPVCVTCMGEAVGETNPGPRLVTIRRTMVRTIPEVTVHTWRQLTSPRGRISVMKR